MGMRASRLARYPKSGDGASKSFLDKFEEIKKELTKRVRGTDSSRMLDPEIYRPTPKYGELQMPASMGPLNNTDETYNYFRRQDRQVKEFNMFLQVYPEVPEGPEPYYRKVYKPLTDVLQKLYPTEFVFPSESVTEGSKIPQGAFSYNESYDPVTYPETNTWRTHPVYVAEKNPEKE